MAAKQQLTGQRRPGIAGIIISIILMVCGPVAGVGIIEYSARESATGVDNSTTYLSDGTPAQITLTNNSAMGVWITHGSHGSCQVYDPSEAPLTLDTDGFTSQTVKEYDLGGIFTPATDGVYTVACSSAGTAFHFKVAPVFPTHGFTTWIIAGVVVMVVVFLVGAALLVAMLVRRYGWHETNKPAPMRTTTPPAAQAGQVTLPPLETTVAAPSAIRRPHGERIQTPPQATQMGFLRPTQAVSSVPPVHTSRAKSVPTYEVAPPVDLALLAQPVSTPDPVPQTEPVSAPNPTSNEPVPQTNPAPKQPVPPANSAPTMESVPAAPAPSAPVLVQPPAPVHPPQVWPPTYTEPSQDWGQSLHSPYGD